MVCVTDTARQLLKRILDDMDHPGFSLRLTYGNGSKRFTFTTDKERKGDQVIEHRGNPVLLISSDVSSDLEGATIDCEERDGKLYLTLSEEMAR